MTVEKGVVQTKVTVWILYKALQLGKNLFNRLHW
jgi:hypothetical protein